jgi:hypothetical protein
VHGLISAGAEIPALHHARDRAANRVVEGTHAVVQLCALREGHREQRNVK